MIPVIETELSQVSRGLAIVGGFIVIYGLISGVVKERLYVSEPLLAVAVGYAKLLDCTDGIMTRAGLSLALAC